MKTFKNLYQEVCSFENLYRAFCLAKKGKLSRFYCAEFSYFRESELLRLQEELAGGAYRHGGYRVFEIFDPKFRQIQAASFRDRVVHHALCNIIEPIFDRGFIYDSFACRKGKGTLLALARCEKLARRLRQGYVLKADISKYFHSVDHEILLGIIARKIGDKAVFKLCAEIINSSEDKRFRRHFPGDDLFSVLRPTGLPIGNLTSQLFSNLYLNELDRFVKHTLRYQGYLRYMDDFLLFAPDKASLHCAMRTIEDFLAEKLRLCLHPKKRTISPVACGIDWVGYQVFPEKVRIRRANICRFRSRNRRLRSLFKRHKIPARDIGQSIQSFCAYASHADAARLVGNILDLEVF